MEFAAFVDDALTPLLRYATALTGDPDLADDLVVDALLTAHRKWTSIRALENPVAYVRRIVTRGFLDDRRRITRRRRILDANAAQLVPVTAGTAEIDAVADRDELAGLLGTLPPQQLAAITLRFYLDLPDAAIAEELGCSPATVRSHVAHGLRALRQAADMIAEEP